MTLAFIFGDVGIGEWFVLLAVILVVVGPRRMPETARKAGKWYARLRRAADSFRRELMDLDSEVTQTVDKAFTVEEDTGERSEVGGEEKVKVRGEGEQRNVKPSSV